MITTNEILLIVGMALVTFMIRYPTLALVGKIQLPEVLLRGLRYVPIAVLVAICVPEIIQLGDISTEIKLTILPAQLIGAVVAMLLAWRTQNLLVTIVGGMGVFLVAKLVFGL
jgi:branched-subunit amino acid transport protein